MKLYAYCLSDEMTASLIEQAAGIAGANPYSIEREGVIAVVSDFDGDAVAVTRENVVTHERVIGSILAQTTPLPFRFGTIVDAERLEQYLETHRDSLLAQLARVRGAVEMSVKIIWDRRAIERATIERLREDDGLETSGPGTAFLAAKRLEVVGSEALNEQAEAIAGWIDERLGELARESSLSTHPEQALVVRAAHLVDRARLDEYRERLKSLKAERRDLRFLTSGPWPPYSFCDLRS